MKKNNTRVTTDADGNKVVTLYRTPVVTFNENTIILNTGGFRTPTTKDRMNQAAIDFRLGFSVFSRNFEWFCYYMGVSIPFNNDTITLVRNF